MYKENTMIRVTLTAETIDSDKRAVCFYLDKNYIKKCVSSYEAKKIIKSFEGQIESLINELKNEVRKWD